MTLEVRAVGDEERADLERIAGAIFDADEDAETDGQSVLVALLKGQVIGFAVRLERTFHPYASSLTLGVLPDHRRCGVGTALLQAILATVPETRIWRALLREDRTAGHAFLERYGFEVMRRTWFAELKAQPQPTLNGFTWLESPMREVVAALIRDHYIATHRINPPGDFDLETWAEALLDEALPDAVRALARDGKLIAATALTRNFDGLEDALDVAFLSVHPDLHDEAQGIVAALVNELLEMAQARDAQRVLLEVDSTDPVTVLALERAEVQGHTWLTLQTGVPVTDTIQP